jgi:LPXTG-motif cell wall-anchored protein
MLRTAILALSASVVLPTAPVFGQEAAAPPPVVTVSPPPPIISAPPAATAPAVPTPRIDIVPRASPTRAAPPAARTAPRAAAPRTVARTRVAAPVRTAAPAPAPAPVAEPVAAAPAPVAAPPVAELPAPAPVVETTPVPVETPAAGGSSMMLWLLAGGAILIAALAFLGLRNRRRADDEVYEETVYEEPTVEAAAEPSFVRPMADPTPIYVAPAAASASAAAPAIAEETSLEDADQTDVDALAADSAPVSGRPWLEFLMRPVRAGTSQDDTIVQFELTVGNTGTVAAKDVRISTWMFAGNEGSDIERTLITPPAGASVSEVDIAAGDGTRVDGEISMPKSGSHDTVLPVVHADARYRLPDGTEGRTSASFSVGLPEGDGIAPFQLDRATGLIETVEARLYGEPERV